MYPCAQVKYKNFYSNSKIILKLGRYYHNYADIQIQHKINTLQHYGLEVGLKINK